MKGILNYLRGHPLVWIVPLILVPLILALVFYLARTESLTPDNPFIYDI
jgi:hypothetical protein